MKFLTNHGDSESFDLREVGELVVELLRAKELANDGAHAPACKGSHSVALQSWWVIALRASSH